MARTIFTDGLRTLYSPKGLSDHPADYVGSRREALDAELAHETRGEFGDLDDFDTAPVRPSSNRTYGPAPVPTTATAAAREVDCPKCAGRGTVTIGYQFQRQAQCFRCNGSGKVSARSAAATKAQATRRENIASWQAEHAAEIAWLNAAAERGFGIASQMLSDLADLGTLTDNRVAKIREWMAKGEAAKAAKAAERNAAAPVAGNAIKAALDNAAKHKKAPTLTLVGFTFSLATSKGANPGAVYVKGEDGTYYGKIVIDGKFLASRDCPADMVPAIIAAAADPQAAAIAYGMETIRCACCGIKLTNELSRQIGIGPICRANFGW